jgi:hypothetical protein
MYNFEDKELASEAGKKSKRGESEKSKQWHNLRDAILSEHTDRFNELLHDMNDEDFVKTYLAVLAYFKPKRLHQDITDDREPTEIIVKLPEPPDEFK